MVKFIQANILWAVILAFAAAVLLSVASVSAQKAPGDTKPGSSLEQRIAQRKKEQKIKLDERNRQRLESTCVRTQTKIRQVRDEYVTVFDHRSEIYRKVDAKLWFAVGSLKYIDKDTFKLEQQRIELLRQVNGFESNAGEFRQVLDDMSSMNCKADVTGFKALLETARVYNSQLRNRADEITNQVVNELKPIVSAHANELRPKASEQ